MRTVLDTNVIISGLFWKGVPGKVLERALKDEYTPCFSEETLAELQRVLNYHKFKVEVLKLPFPPDVFLARLAENAILVPSPKVQLKIIKTHPSDDKFLACALAAQASFIVSGDKHLLALKKFQEIPILTPEKFIRLYPSY